MQVTRIDEGLWRWTAPHPGWRSADGGWDREVGCTYLETRDAIVLVDPLVPSDAAQATRFWDALDRDVRRLGLPVVVMVTVRWHRRSADAVLHRYPGSRRWGPRPTRTPAPDGVVPHRVRTAREWVLWLPAHRTLVVGDTLLGAGDGAVRTCPASWLPEGRTRDELVRDLRPLLDLPVRRVLTSHGPPVLDGGHAALAAALSGPPAPAA